MIKNKPSLGVRLFSFLAGIIFILIGIDFYKGIVPGLKTVTEATAIITILVGLIGIVLAVIDKKESAATEAPRSA